MKKNKTVEISKTIKGNPPKGLPFEKIKNAVLGEKYNLSIVFCAEALSRKINKLYRNKDSATDILSFPLSKTEGEIFINLSRVKKDSKKNQIKLQDHILYLFIHGLYHLKGFSHGSRMEKEEQKIRRQFSLDLE
jgi:probable rRNA maturation factor